MGEHQGSKRAHDQPLGDDCEQRRIPVTLEFGQWNLLLRALEYRYDSASNDPEYRKGIAVGVEITRALENDWSGREPEQRARQMREEIERRMSRANLYPSQFSEMDRRAVESVLADIIRESAGSHA